MDIIGMTLLGYLFLLIISVALMVAYIYTLIKQIKAKEYAWFVVTLVLSPAMIVYWIVKLMK